METDRSRILTFQSCPRQRYLGYHVGGTGLQKIRKALPLQFGSAFHEGSAILLTEHGLDSNVDPGSTVDAAVANALAFLDTQFAAHQIGFDGELPDDAQKSYDYAVGEQKALAEALLRAWWAYEGESFLSNFEVIEVEQEGRAQLLAGLACGIGDGNLKTVHDALTLMYRPDALVRDRQSGDLYVVSWKTCATFGKRNIDQAKTDMQSISECWGVAQERGLKIEGVLYKFAVKGRRSKDDWDGIYKQNTPLVYGWMRLGASPEETEWSWQYAWSDPEEINEKTGKPVGHKLGKGWKKVPIWSTYPGGVKAWIEALSKNEIAPRFINALEAVFPQALPVERRKDEVESWRRQVIAQELRIDANLTAMGSMLSAEDLDDLFPQHTASCYSYSGCPFLDVCWGGVPAEPSELYQIRSANHPEGDYDE